MSETRQAAVTPQELQREYNRQYYAKNRERIQENKRKYWQRKADALNAAAAAESEAERE